MTITRQTIYSLVLSYFLFSCMQKKEKSPGSNFTRYDLDNPVIIKLPDELNQISGIAYYAKDTSVFAEVDEAGVLYKIPLNKLSKIKKWEFDKKHHFEDIVLHDSVFYVLISNGDIESVKFGKDGSIITATSQFPNTNKKNNEFESMYFDNERKELVILCKNCEDDNDKVVSKFAYDIVTNTYSDSAGTIDVQPIAKKLGVEKLKVKPSAIALNPVTNEYYILASVNKLLVVTDEEWKLKEVYQLDPSIYKQPEGIAFTPSGDMLISNEAKESAATILLFKNNKK